MSICPDSGQGLVPTDVCMHWKCGKEPLVLRGSHWCCPRCDGNYGADAKEGLGDLRASPAPNAPNAACWPQRKLLLEAAALFRTYEAHHRAKSSEDGRSGKADRNAEIAGRIEREVVGRTFDEFKADVAARFVERGGMTPDEAEPYASDIVHVYLAEENIFFGDGEYAWDADTAREIADTDMSYWED